MAEGHPGDKGYEPPTDHPILDHLGSIGEALKAGMDAHRRLSNALGGYSDPKPPADGGSAASDMGAK